MEVPCFEAVATVVWERLAMERHSSHTPEAATIVIYNSQTTRWVKERENSRSEKEKMLQQKVENTWEHGRLLHSCECPPRAFSKEGTFSKGKLLCNLLQCRSTLTSNSLPARNFRDSPCPTRPRLWGPARQLTMLQRGRAYKTTLRKCQQFAGALMNEPHRPAFRKEPAVDEFSGRRNWGRWAHWSRWFLKLGCLPTRRRYRQVAALALQQSEAVRRGGRRFGSV